MITPWHITYRTLNFKTLIVTQLSEPGNITFQKIVVQHDQWNKIANIVDKITKNPPPLSLS